MGKSKHCREEQWQMTRETSGAVNKLKTNPSYNQCGNFFDSQTKNDAGGSLSTGRRAPSKQSEIPTPSAALPATIITSDDSQFGPIR
jgi:hypothetical protein